MFFLVGVMSVLDAATNDLMQLVGHLDLESTPGTSDTCVAAAVQPGESPISVRQQVLAIESPGKNGKTGLLRRNFASTTSQCPYADT